MIVHQGERVEALRSGNQGGSNRHEGIEMKGLHNCWNNSMFYPMKLKGLAN
jgi:hypothetical protein